MVLDTEKTLDETWDDSELVASWNSAYEEYKKYHSVAACGERVPLERHEPNVQAKEQSADGGANVSNSGLNNTNHDGLNMESKQSGRPDDEMTHEATAKSSVPPAPSDVEGVDLPQHLLGSHPTGDFKNLLMSWYYAGYYTGLYEGQQRAWYETQQKP